METISILQKFRFQYSPKLPAVYENGCKAVALSFGEPTESIDNQKELKEIFGNTYGKPIAQAVSGENPEAGVKRRVGVVLSGGQAPGGHNVIAGIFDALKDLNADSELLGFLKGPAGILDDKKVPLTRDIIDTYRNTGGFDMIGSGRTKIEKENQFARALEVCQKSSIDALIIIGGDDSNTNAALLAEYFVEQNAAIQVIGIPKTIDGDLKNEYIEISFGFDTATKTYSELIGNIERDANSAKKYWHFIKLMGRSASHICLECALQVRPNVAVISEEVNEKKTALNDIVEHIAEVVKIRSEKGENFGVVLVPEGLIEFIPEVGTLIRELNDLLAGNESYFNSLHTFEDQSEWVNKRLSKDASYVFSSLPNNIQRQLLMDRDPHGNVQVSRIETEKLLIEMVDDRLNEMRSQGVFQGKFSTQSHFFGYEGRCAFPSNFDADYCYSLGYNALVLIANGLTGYISSVQNLAQPAEEWTAGGIPITMMMNLERRHGNDKPVIKKALVELDGKPFQEFAAYRDEWSTTTSYTYPGAIQYYGPKEICDKVTETIRLESEDRSES